MSNAWVPKEEHNSVIAKSIEFISDGLSVLQESIRCSNLFIIEIENKVVSEYQRNQTIIRIDEE
tara:strand:- start:247 stop:438 length:192 start_codon:yes stop_codon:yes gene_type:complete